MLNEEQINQNKETFIALVQSIERPGVDKEGLFAKLNNSDFFVAPASAKYHCAFKGGLVQHCLNVYENLCKLVKMSYPIVKQLDENGIEQELDTCPYSADTLKIVALFHDFSKMNYYEGDVKNKKVYSAAGKKYDEMGKFDWVAVPGYKTREAEDRFVFANHEITAFYMTEAFFPLRAEEASAILHHMGGMSYDCTKEDISEVFNKYPLALLLHLADMMSTYINEKESATE